MENRRHKQPRGSGKAIGLADRNGAGQLRPGELALHREDGQGSSSGPDDAFEDGNDGGMAEAEGQRRNGRQDSTGTPGRSGAQNGSGVAHAEGRRVVIRQETEREAKPSGVGAAGFWDDAVWIPCADGKARRLVARPVFLADGLSAAVDRGGDEGAEEVDATQELWEWILSINRAVQMVTGEELLHALSFGASLARLEGDEVSHSALRALHEASLSPPFSRCTADLLEQVWINAASQETGKGCFVMQPINPLTEAFPGRAVLLRGAGNAIVPALAAEFVKAYLRTREENGSL